MVKYIEGKLDGKGRKVALVASRFNDFICEKLITGALDCLTRHNVADEAITVVRVPGSFEIPPVARRLAESDNYDGIICLGVVIRGATPHFDYVCNEASKGIAHVARETAKPIGFGLITADTIEQAVERAGTKAGNKGWDAALTVLELMSLGEHLG